MEADLSNVYGVCRVILRYSWSMENDAPFYELERILGNILHSFVGLGGVVHSLSLSLSLSRKHPPFFCSFICVFPKFSSLN